MWICGWLIFIVYVICFSIVARYLRRHKIWDYNSSYGQNIIGIIVFLILSPLVLFGCWKEMWNDRANG